MLGHKDLRPPSSVCLLREIRARRQVVPSPQRLRTFAALRRESKALIKAAEVTPDLEHLHVCQRNARLFHAIFVGASARP